MVERALTYGSMDYWESKPKFIVPADGSPAYHDRRTDPCGDQDVYDHDNMFLGSGHALFRDEDPVDYTRHFILQGYTPPAQELLGRRGVVVAGGDVRISLSPEEEDTIIVSSRTLVEAHPWWKASLSKDWTASKTLQNSNTKYYELEFESDGYNHEAFLAGKSHPTSASERQRKYDAIREKCWAYIHSGTITKWCFDNVNNVMFEEFACATISAHKLGFALLCGHDLRAWSSKSWSHMTWPHDPRENRNMFPSHGGIILLRLLDWIQDYGSLQSLSSRVEDFVLSRQHYATRPMRLLRVACLLESEALFKLAMPSAVYFFGYWLQRQRDDCTPTSHAESRLLAELGGDYDLAARVKDEHRKLELTFAEVNRNLDMLVLPEDFSAYNKQGLRVTQWMEYHFRPIWVDWLNKNRRYDYFLHNTYETLGRGTIDVASIVGHWKARNKTWAKKLLRKTTTEEMVSVLQMYFDHAGKVVVRPLHYENEFGTGYRSSADFSHDMLEEMSSNLLDEEYMYPWDESRNYYDEAYDFGLDKILEEPALGDYEDRKGHGERRGARPER